MVNARAVTGIITKNILKVFLVSGPLVFLAGCAADDPYTANTVGAHEAAYRDCVRSKASESSPSSATPAEIARKAGIQCQGQLVLINDKLREENRWHQYYGAFADRYTDALRERTLEEVSGEIADRRQ